MNMETLRMKLIHAVYEISLYTVSYQRPCKHYKISNLYTILVHANAF